MSEFRAESDCERIEDTASTPLVFVIILNWNGLQDTLQCLSSLEKLRYRNKKIVVVDNGSTDGSGESISQLYPGVCLLRNAENEGFCRGNNNGIRYSLDQGADYVWLLNNDSEVESDALEHMIRMAESSDRIGLVSPMIYYFEEKERIQFAGSYWDDTVFSERCPQNQEDIEGIFQVGGNIILWGTALLIRRSVIEKIGLLDERFFAYCEDTDYSLRSLKSGYFNVVCKDARVYHKKQITAEGNETKRKAYFYYFRERNYLLLRRKEVQGGLDKIGFYLFGFAVGSTHTWLWPAEFVDAALTGIWHGLRGIHGPHKTLPAMPRYLKKILVRAARIHPIFVYNLISLNLKAARRQFLRWNYRLGRGQANNSELTGKELTRHLQSHASNILNVEP